MSEGRLELDIETVDVGAVLRERAAAFSAAAEAVGSRMTVRASTILAACDRFRVEQIVDNLISNTLKYGEGRRMKVSAEYVRDRGSFE